MRRVVLLQRFSHPVAKFLYYQGHPIGVGMCEVQSNQTGFRANCDLGNQFSCYSKLRSIYGLQPCLIEVSAKRARKCLQRETSLECLCAKKNENARIYANEMPMSPYILD